MKLLTKIKNIRKVFLLLNCKLLFRKVKNVAFYSTLGVGSLGSIFSLLYLEQRNVSAVQCAQIQNDNEITNSSPLYIQSAINKSKPLLERLKIECNCPAMTITVTIDGEEVWKEGLGLADVENGIPCTPDTVMRIASISKPMTMAVAAKLIENGSLDLDEDVCHYVPEWPVKTFNGKESKITTRMLISMMGGIRSYDKTCGIRKNNSTKNDVQVQEFDYSEYYLTKRYSSVVESLDVFKDDMLCYKPGSQFFYSTYSFTLVSAVVEKVAKKKFELVLKKMFEDLNLKNTYLDENLPIIHNRARYYTIKSSRLQNAPYVDNSYKWAGGGLLSTTSDLCIFGNTMLACFQGVGKKAKTKNAKSEVGSEVDNKEQKSTDNKEQKSTDNYYFTPYLSKKTMKMVWTPVIKTNKPTKNAYYAMGWEVTNPRPQLSAIFPNQTNHMNRRCFYHTGGAVGASSILLIMPRDMEKNTSKPLEKFAETDQLPQEENINQKLDPPSPRGTVVAILTNMQNVRLKDTAQEIAATFEAHLEQHHQHIKAQTSKISDVDYGAPIETNPLLKYL